MAASRSRGPGGERVQRAPGGSARGRRRAPARRPAAARAGARRRRQARLAAGEVGRPREPALGRQRGTPPCPPGGGSARRTSGHGHGRAERGASLAERGLERLAPARALGVGQQHDREPADGRADRARADPAREPRRDRVDLSSRSPRALRHSPATRPPRRQRAAASSPRTARRSRTVSSAAGGSWASSRSRRAPAALGLARRLRLRLGEARGRLGRDLVDVGEDRLAEVVERVGRRSRPACPPRRSAATPAARRRGRRRAARPASGRRGTRPRRAGRRCRAGSRGGSPASTSTKRLSATSTPKRTPRPKRPSIARA